MLPAFVQQQHIYGEVLKAEGHIYLLLKHILGNQEREAHSFPTFHLSEFWTVHACSLPFLLHLSFPFVFSLSTQYLTPLSCHPDSWFIATRRKRESHLEGCVALGGRQVAWRYTTGPCGLHCCPAALTSFDIHTYLIPCKTADLVTIQQAEFKRNKSSAV